VVKKIAIMSRIDVMISDLKPTQVNSRWGSVWVNSPWISAWVKSRWVYRAWVNSCWGYILKFEVGTGKMEREKKDFLFTKAKKSPYNDKPS